MKRCKVCGREAFDVETTCACGGELKSSAERIHGSQPEEKPYKKAKSKGSMILSYISGVIYPIILSGICIWIHFLSNATSTGGTILLVFGIVFSILMGVVMIFGGFYLIIVPLPVIFIWKIGCCKSQTRKRKMIFGTLSVVFPIFVITCICLFYLV